MKKILLFLAVATISLTAAQSQNMKLGASVSLPVGDAGDVTSVGLQADFTYLFEINDAFQVGPMASLNYYVGKKFNTYFGSVKGKDFMFLPVGGHARFLLDEFFFGADLGYGIGLSPSGNDGGVFFRPKAGYDFGVITTVLSFSGVALSGTTFTSVNAGVEFSF